MRAHEYIPQTHPTASSSTLVRLGIVTTCLVTETIRVTDMVNSARSGNNRFGITGSNANSSTLPHASRARSPASTRPEPLPPPAGDAAARRRQPSRTDEKTGVADDRPGRRPHQHGGRRGPRLTRSWAPRTQQHRVRRQTSINQCAQSNAFRVAFATQQANSETK